MDERRDGTQKELGNVRGRLGQPRLSRIFPVSL